MLKSKAWTNSKGLFVLGYNHHNKQIEAINENDCKFYRIPLGSVQFEYDYDSKNLTIIDKNSLKEIVIGSITAQVYLRMKNYLRS